MKKNSQYGNESISALKGADRVRKRPGVIFGSDSLDGCQHAVFEILSNSIDEAREGYGNEIIVTRYADHSIEVEDHGRGVPVDYNANEKRYNWELVFCEMYAGGKYENTGGDNYEFSLGLNGLGTCATQYSSEYMDVTVRRDGAEYSLHFEKGENCTGTKTGFKKKKYTGTDTGTKIRWRPDLEVFTDVQIPETYYLDVLKRQAVVNPKLRFIFRNETPEGIKETEFYYENGISDYVTVRTSRNIKCCSTAPFAFRPAFRGWSIITTLRGWNTAARRTKRCALHLSQPLTPISSKTINTTKTRAASRFRMCRTA